MTPQHPAYALEAAVRTQVGKQIKQLRREGQLPAVMYGNNQKNQALTIDGRAFTKLFREAGSTSLISLAIDKSAPVKVLVHDIQINPTTHAIEHVDFLQVNLKEKLRTEIPLSFVGVSPAVDVEGGNFLAVKDAVEVECLPEDLVQEIEVDISVLATFEDAIRLQDIQAPAKVTILGEPEEMIASVSAPRTEAELEELDSEIVETTPEAEGEADAEAGEDEKAE